MITRLTMALALASAGAFASAADELPQGHFMAAPFFADDTLLPRYIALEVDGAHLALSFFSQITFDHEACESQQVCEHRLLAASADAELEDGRLVLKEVDIDTEVGLDVPRFGSPHLRYTAPLLEAMQGATFSETDWGYDLRFGDNTLSFFRATPNAQDAIAAFAVAMNLSIRNLAGCEVSSLAPLFDDPAPSEAQALFRSALMGLELQADLLHQTEAIGDTFAMEEDDPRVDEYRRLQRIGMAPQLLAFTTSPDATLTDRLSQLLENEAGPAFEQQDTEFYGPHLPAMVALFDYFQTSPEINATAACTDPSFGFIAAQGG